MSEAATIDIRIAKASDAGTIAETHDEAWRATYRGLIPGAELEQLIARRGAIWWDSALSKGNRISLILFGEDVVGYANYGRNRAKALPQDGEIYELYLKPQYIGIGLGRRLFSAVKRDLMHHGIKSIVMWVLSENEAGMQFCRAMGGKAVARSTEAFGPKTLDKTAFAWTL